MSLHVRENRTMALPDITIPLGGELNIIERDIAFSALFLRRPDLQGKILTVILVNERTRSIQVPYKSLSSPIRLAARRTSRTWDLE